ncbi:hypothetical protein Rmet_6494 [Cupriavidus metallidurans CH34]|uniref:Uncharacterized protein n=1 Tax=Cupriavidus metallidurans (strain ATCC 43123 / DSM 2839 / NBRC 102507 / CH34) TaxID=266264 RepID=D3DXT2_CUPMC|nr:hypothetical protein Rmet_6494 [Cupriavidus metallidurans CH34]
MHRTCRWAEVCAESLSIACQRAYKTLSFAVENLSMRRIEYIRGDFREMALRRAGRLR